MSGIKNIIVSNWSRLFLLLLLVYGGQVYPYYHQHHIHYNGQLSYEANSHTIEIDVEHAAGHTHHDGESHQGDQASNHHEALHQGHIDWHLNRVQTSRIDILADQSAFISALRFSCLPVSKYFVLDDNLPTVVNYHASYRMFRGPPVLTWLFLSRVSSNKA